MESQRHILVAGATGTVGAPLIEAILSSKMTLSVLVREQTVSSISEKSTQIKKWEARGAKLVFGDVLTDTLEDLKKLLVQSKCDVVVSCLGDTLIKEGQSKLIEAAISVESVKWFIPSEWAWDYTVIGRGSVVADVEDQKIEQRERLSEASKSRPDFSYTIICAGLFIDFFVHELSGIDLKGRRFAVPGSLDLKLSLTSISNTARYTVHLLSRGLTDDVKNQTIYFSDETVSVGQALSQLESATGSKWTVTIRPLNELVEQEKIFRQEGKTMEAWFEGFRILMIQQVGVAWTESQVYNTKHFPPITNAVHQFVLTSK